MVRPPASNSSGNGASAWLMCGRATSTVQVRPAIARVCSRRSSLRGGSASKLARLLCPERVTSVVVGSGPVAGGSIRPRSLMLTW